MLKHARQSTASSKRSAKVKEVVVELNLQREGGALMGRAGLEKALCRERGKEMPGTVAGEAD